jgi:hypothetical protein
VVIGQIVVSLVNQVEKSTVVDESDFCMIIFFSVIKAVTTSLPQRMNVKRTATVSMSIVGWLLLKGYKVSDSRPSY